MTIELSLSPPPNGMGELIQAIAIDAGTAFTPEQLGFISSSLAAMDWNLVDFSNTDHRIKAEAVINTAIDMYARFGVIPEVSITIQKCFIEIFGEKS